MTYSLIIVTKDRVSVDRHFFVRELTRHFKSHIQDSLSAWFKLEWAGNNLVLTTNSAYLVGQWWGKERDFVEFFFQPLDPSAEALDYPWEFLSHSAA